MIHLSQYPYCLMLVIILVLSPRSTWLAIGLDALRTGDIYSLLLTPLLIV